MRPNSVLEKPAEPQLGVIRFPEWTEGLLGEPTGTKASGWPLALRAARDEAGSVAAVQLPRTTLMS